MPNERADIVSMEVDVYISAAGADHSDGSAGHTLLGWAEQNSIVLTTEDVYSKQLHNNTPHQTGVKMKFEAMLQEVSPAKITALEAFKNQDVDIVLINRADRTAGDVFANGGLVISPDFKYTVENTKEIKIEVGFSAVDFSDIFTALSAATGYV